MNKPTTGKERLNTDRLPVFALKIPDFHDLNTRLKRKLKTMSTTVPDQVSNMSNGQSYFDNKWLSQPVLHKSDDPDFQRLVSFVEETANRSFRFSDPRPVLCVTSMWGMVSKSGLTGNRHNHAGWISGAYYVDAGSSGTRDGGLIQFYQKPEFSQPSHQSRPESGQLLLFPSSLEHSVSRYDGDRSRIVISLNLNPENP